MKYYRGLLLLLFLLCVYTKAALALLWWCAGGIWVTQEFILSLPLSFHSLFYSSTNILSFGKQKRPGVLLLFYYFKRKKRKETRQKKRMFSSLLFSILSFIFAVILKPGVAVGAENDPPPLLPTPPHLSPPISTLVVVEKEEECLKIYDGPFHFFFCFIFLLSLFRILVCCFSVKVGKGGFGSSGCRSV
jgi:hypothetical protein